MNETRDEELIFDLAAKGEVEIACLLAIDCGYSRGFVEDIWNNFRTFGENKGAKKMTLCEKIQNEINARTAELTALINKYEAEKEVLTKGLIDLQDRLENTPVDELAKEIA